MLEINRRKLMTGHDDPHAQIGDRPKLAREIGRHANATM